MKRIVAVAALSILIVSILLSLIIPPAGQAYAYVSVQATCRDTVVNYSAQCTAQAEPNDTIVFKVVKPDGTAVRFDARADKGGKATASLSRYHTTREGHYKVAAYLSWIKEPKTLAYDNFSVIGDSIGSESASEYLNASVTGGVGGPIATFKITAPASAKVGEAFDITICAVDEANLPVQDYRGTILFFAAGDPNAVLPFQNDGYTFTGTDQDACHAFAKGVTLTKAGAVTLAVADVDNPDISSDVPITVTDTGNANVNGSSSPAPGTGNINITAPSNNSSYGDTSLNILGQGPKSVRVGIFDGTRELGSVQADADGDFSYTAKNLTDGKHNLIAEAFDEAGASMGKSSEVIVTINTKGAELGNLTILPSDTVAPATPVTVTVTSEPRLSRVRLILDLVAHDLMESASAPGTYQATFAAPTSPGTYDIKLGLTNSLNKETSPAVTKKLTVRAGQDKLAVTASLGDKSGTAKVNWQPPRDSGSIKEYRVFYGTNPIEPQFNTRVLGTSSSATVEGLQGDTLYYFSVAPVYDGNREGVLSDSASVKTPSAALPFIENTRAIGGVQRITLTWDEPDVPSTSIRQYIIDYSSSREKPEAQARTDNNMPSWYIPNLETCKEYFFQLTAVDATGKPLARSAIFNGKTSCGNDNVCQQAGVTGLRVDQYTDGSQVLAWNPVAGARAYRVYGGSAPENYDYGAWDVTDTLFPVFPDRFPSGDELFFAVQALGEGDCFANAALSKAVRTHVGPAAEIIFTLSLMTGLSIIIRRRMAEK